MCEFQAQQRERRESWRTVALRGLLLRLQLRELGGERHRGHQAQGRAARRRWRRQDGARVPVHDLRVHEHLRRLPRWVKRSETHFSFSLSAHASQSHSPLAQTYIYRMYGNGTCIAQQQSVCVHRPAHLYAPGVMYGIYSCMQFIPKL
jgi:hypothetical protein